MATDNKLNAQQAQMAVNPQTIEKMEQELKEIDSNSKKMNKKLQALGGKCQIEESCVLQLQMERASYVLRLQGIQEEKGENLRQIVGDLLAPLAEMTSEQLQSEIDMVFRSYSEFIRKNNLPGEVTIRFSRKKVRDQLLKATNGVTLKIKDKDIKVLKDVPFEIRRKKKKYRDLVSFLQSHNVSYRWFIPEGLIFRYANVKERNDSVEKACEFLRQHGRPAGEGVTDGSKVSEEEREAGSDEDSDSKLGAVGPKPSYQLRHRKGKK